MMSNKIILDTSALLALINNEIGADIICEQLPHAHMSTVNIAEVTTYLHRNGYADLEKINNIISLVRPVEFTCEYAMLVGQIINLTKQYGLSLGDRACLATAKILNIPVYTADKAWNNLTKALNLQIIQIR